MTVVAGAIISDECSIPRLLFRLPFMRTLFVHWNRVFKKACWAHDVRYKHQAYSFLWTNLLFGWEMLTQLLRFVRTFPWDEMPAVFLEGIFIGGLMWLSVMLFGWVPWLRQKRQNQLRYRNGR